MYVGVFLGSDAQGASNKTSLHTAESAMPPSFGGANSHFKGSMVSYAFLSRQDFRPFDSLHPFDCRHHDFRVSDLIPSPLANQDGKAFEATGPAVYLRKKIE